jgi:hypothetical protein
LEGVKIEKACLEKTQLSSDYFAGWKIDKYPTQKVQ